MNWNNHQELSLTNLLSPLEESQSQADHTLFYNHSSDGKLVVLIVYVDDIILTWDNPTKLDILKNFLAKEFEAKDLGAWRYFEEWSFLYQRKVFLCHKYTLDLPKKTRFLGCKPTQTPIDPTCKLQLLKESKCVGKECY